MNQAVLGHNIIIGHILAALARLVPPPVSGGGPASRQVATSRACEQAALKFEPPR